MPLKEAQVNLRLPRELDQWLEVQAGGKRYKPGYIRRLLERERARDDEAALQDMFDRAWDSLSEAEKAGVRAEREEWMQVRERLDRS